MFPHVGLYLPESLLPKKPTASNRSEGVELEQKPISRKYWERKSSDIPTRVPTPSGSIQNATTFSAPLSTVSKFVDFVSSLKEVPTESAVFVNLIKRVCQDEAEAQQLHCSQAASEYYESWPDRKAWVDAILLDVRRSIDEIGVYIESGRMTAEGGGAVGMKHRFEWVLNHHQKLLTRQNSLIACHQSLMAAIQMLQMVEMNTMYGSQCQTLEAPMKPWLLREKSEVLRSPHSRHKLRLGQRNGSVPSISISSEHDEQSEVSSINETPAELPGSTPEDLPRADNLDLYEPPRKPKLSSLELSPLEPLPDISRHTPLTSQRPRSSSDHATSGLGTQTSTHASSLLPPLSSPEASRRSLDQANSPSNGSWNVPLSKVRECMLQPTLQTSPQVRSEQVLSVAPSTEQSNAAPGFQPENTPDDVTVECDATQSNMMRTSKPTVLAMRYRPKSVHVRRPLTKHRSLPSALPFLPVQPSLTSELSHWVLPAPEDSSRDSPQQSVIENTPPASQTPSPVCPDTPASCPASFQRVVSVASKYSVPSVASATHTTASANSPLKEIIVGFEDEPTPQVSTNSLLRVKETSHSTGMKNRKGIPREDSPTIGAMEFKCRPTPMEDISESPPPSTREINHETRSQSPDIIQISASSTQIFTHSSIRDSKFSEQTPTSPSTTISSQDPTSPTVNLEQMDLSAAGIGINIPIPPIQSSQNVTLPSVIPEPKGSSSAGISVKTSTPAVPPSQTPMSPIVSLEPVDPGCVEADVKPMTSLAKRRRAHARMMQAAYGLE